MSCDFDFEYPSLTFDLTQGNKGEWEAIGPCIKCVHFIFCESDSQLAFMIHWDQYDSEVNPPKPLYLMNEVWGNISYWQRI